MIIPVRCFSCGLPVAEVWDEFQEAVQKGKDAGKTLDKLGVTKYCCRRMMLSQVDLLPLISRYKKS
jgi:DNA-directed RNA polymerase subunit N